MRSGEEPSRVNWWPRRVPDRFRCKARRCGAVGVAKSICADVSWRHLLVQSSELRALRLCLPRGGRQADLSLSSVSLPGSPARLLSSDPVDAAALFTLTRITITLVRLHIRSPMSRRNVDNDGATVIRRTGDCYRTVRPDPVQTDPGIIGRIDIASRKWTSSGTRLTTSVRAWHRYHHGSKVKFALCAWYSLWIGTAVWLLCTHNDHFPLSDNHRIPAYFNKRCNILLHFGFLTKETS